MRQIGWKILGFATTWVVAIKKPLIRLAPAQ